MLVRTARPRGDVNRVGWILELAHVVRAKDGDVVVRLDERTQARLVVQALPAIFFHQRLGARAVESAADYGLASALLSRCAGDVTAISRTGATQAGARAQALRRDP